MNRYFNPMRGVLLFFVSLVFSISCAGNLLPEDDISSDPTGVEDAEGSDEAEDQGAESGAVESFSTGDQYLYIPSNGESLDSAAYPAMSSLQIMASGHVKIFDPDLHFPIDWEDEDNIPPLVDPDEVQDYMKDNDHPNGYTCALPVDPSTTGVFSTGGIGTNPVPARDASWSGSGGGGCGTWATLMCNRILGETDPDQEVTKDEWNDTADAIDQNPSGGSQMTDQSEYYESLGYCVNDKKFGGSAEDYAEMVERIHNGCDVKLFFWRRMADGTYTNGHVETVTGANASDQTATTNSWGQPGTIRGGGNGGFDHSLDGTQFQDGAGNELWPADSTEVWVSYVCECGFFEGLAKKLFGF